MLVAIHVALVPLIVKVGGNGVESPVDEDSELGILEYKDGGLVGETLDRNPSSVRRDPRGGGVLKLRLLLEEVWANRNRGRSARS